MPPNIPFSLQIKTHQMFSGLAAGNIGDELMMLGFLTLARPMKGGTIEVWDAESPAVQWFPEEFSYISWMDNDVCERCASASHVVLLVGGTPVSELVGLDWPLKALEKRLKYCHVRGVPVHGVGVGVDRLKKPEARRIFQEAFLPIASWTVRSAHCRDALRDLGVPQDRIVVASDLAWLHAPISDRKAWASSRWKILGVDLSRPLIGVNVVSEVWKDNTALYQNLAIALDGIARDHDAQIAFMCNEVREGPYFDRAAALSVMGMMETSPFLLPNHYYHPDEMIALLSHVDVTLSQRYHFTIESVMAGTVPVSFARGQKLAGLIEELGMHPVGDMDEVHPEDIRRHVADVLEHRDCWRDRLLPIKHQLKLRAMNNKHFIQQLFAEDVGYATDIAMTDDSDIVKLARLASSKELNSFEFKGFMSLVNGLAIQWGLRVFTNWSKIWEYPWLWFNGLHQIKWPGKHLVDMGSEISPMPWLIALLGAKVTLIETDAQWIPAWEKLRDRLRVDVQWRIVSDEILPIPDASVDVLTSFSVIEHQPKKADVMKEIDRVLKPGGIMAISFDICEAEMGMTFPEWNGAALTMQEFNDVIWRHPAFGNVTDIAWNTDDIPAFLSWHQTSAPHHRYVVGAAVLQKKIPKVYCTFRYLSGWFDEEYDTSGCWRWSDSQGVIELRCGEDCTVSLQFELSSLPPDNRVHMLLDDREVMVMAIDWSGFNKLPPVEISLSAGIHTVTFHSDMPSVILPEDTRNLAFSIKNFTASLSGGDSHDDDSGN